MGPKKIKIDDINKKLINLKISKNGKFQITGCKSIDICLQSVIHLLNIIISDEKFFVKPESHILNIIFNVSFYTIYNGLFKCLTYCSFFIDCNIQFIFSFINIQSFVLIVIQFSCNMIE